MIIVISLIITYLIIITFLMHVRIRNIYYKQEIIWDYILSRAQLAFLQKGLGTKNSPIILNDETRNWYNPIADDLKNTYKKIGVKFTDRELFQIIFKKYGDWIFENICIPYSLHNGECIIAAMAVAKEG